MQHSRCISCCPGFLFLQINIPHLSRLPNFNVFQNKQYKTDISFHHWQDVHCTSPSDSLVAGQSHKENTDSAGNGSLLEAWVPYQPPSNPMDVEMSLFALYDSYMYSVFVNAFLSQAPTVPMACEVAGSPGLAICSQ